MREFVEEFAEVGRWANFEADLRVPARPLQAFGEIWSRRNTTDKVKNVKIFRNQKVCVLCLHADRMWLPPRAAAITPR
ncbi:hypothetical protein [Dactylosporangium maewongense]|uniref:hypothetical protein n=1 Tax=Dactylosporangium maewongense TaxID=634393 RepID=UPI0031E3BA36